jgi:hypothetical protein
MEGNIVGKTVVELDSNWVPEQEIVSLKEKLKQSVKGSINVNNLSASEAQALLLLFSELFVVHLHQARRRPDGSKGDKDDLIGELPEYIGQITQQLTNGYMFAVNKLFAN